MQSQKRAIFIALVLALCPQFAKSQEPEKISLNWLVQAMTDVDLSEMGRGAPYYTQATCSRLLQVERKTEAVELWERCFELVMQESNGKVDSHDLMDAALEMNRLDLARRVLDASDTQTDAMRDQIALYLFKQGNEQALAKYPHGVPMMTFYDAMDLGQTYIEMERFEALEELLSDLKITEENAPEDVAGILYEKIAQDARQAGDQERAEKYIDKAFTIAGRQFYTGYGVKVAHRAIHGRLVETVDDLTGEALAYRGHMARELMQGLIAELLTIGEYDLAAKIAAEHLEDPEDQARALARLAQQRADAGDYRGALGMVRRLTDPQQQNAVRLRVAIALLKIGKREAALELANFVRERLEPQEKHENLRASLAEFSGMLRDRELLDSTLAATENSFRRGQWLHSAFDGFRAMEHPPRLSK